MTANFALGRDREEGGAIVENMEAEPRQGADEAAIDGLPTRAGRELGILVHLAGVAAPRRSNLEGHEIGGASRLRRVVREVGDSRCGAAEHDLCAREVGDRDPFAVAGPRVVGDLVLELGGGGGAGHGGRKTGVAWKLGGHGLLWRAVEGIDLAGRGR